MYNPGSHNADASFQHWLSHLLQSICRARHHGDLQSIHEEYVWEWLPKQRPAEELN